MPGADADGMATSGGASSAVVGSAVSPSPICAATVTGTPKRCASSQTIAKISATRCAVVCAGMFRASMVNKNYEA